MKASRPTGGAGEPGETRRDESIPPYGLAANKDVEVGVRQSLRHGCAVSPPFTHRPHCNGLQRPAARRWEPKVPRRLVAAPSETRLLFAQGRLWEANAGFTQGSLGRRGEMRASRPTGGVRALGGTKKLPPAIRSEGA